jgi:phytoene dehydrogenase-like protein
VDADVIVIGAGLSGLACALRLQQGGLTPLVLEAADRPGGRIATDRLDGFRLDRGFQVLQSWYPQARRLLDYPALDLRAFYPGALVRIDDRFHRVSDVWRRPGRTLEMLASPVGSLGDKLRLLALRRRALAGDLADLYGRPETTAMQRLRDLGFSSGMIERFFRPFFAGVFFAPDLDVSSRAFEFVFRAFALGDTALPALGMEQIPLQLAARLPADAIAYGRRVVHIDGNAVVLAGGEHRTARAVVLATGCREAAGLLGQDPPPLCGTTCLYFAAPEPPFSGPYLVLNGCGPAARGGPINSLLCPSNLSAAYAPPGSALVSVNCFGADTEPDLLEAQVRRQLTDWFGERVAGWRRLAVYRLPDALPRQGPPVSAKSSASRLSEALWVCGEAVAPPSIHWALASGETAAGALIAALGGPAQVG